MRKAVCVTNLSKCQDCGLLDSCPYPNLFENPTPKDATKLSRYPFTPNPFVLEPDFPRGDYLDLGLVLFGSAIQDLSTAVTALRKAAEGGLTDKRIRLGLHSTSTERTCAGWTQGLEARSQQLPENNPPRKVRIRLLTPLRIKKKGRYTSVRAFDFRAFAANLLRRISLLTHFFDGSELEADYAECLRRAEQLTVHNPSLEWRDLTRYSNRQEVSMKMGGLVGSFEIALEGIEFLWPVLVAGQWTHLGKGCTFGLGRYALEPLGIDQQTTWATPAPLEQMTTTSL